MNLSPYQERGKTIKSLRSKLIAYQTAVNRVDDYFEYSCKSAKDRDVVFNILSKLCKNLGDKNGKDGNL